MVLSQGKPRLTAKQPGAVHVGAYGKLCSPILEKNREGKAIEIANLSGLKVTSVHQTLLGLKRVGHVKQDKKRGSPFVLARK